MQGLFLMVSYIDAISNIQGIYTCTILVNVEVLQKHFSLLLYTVHVHKYTDAVGWMDPLGVCTLFCVRDTIEVGFHKGLV